MVSIYSFLKKGRFGGPKGLGFRVEGFGFRVWGLGFRVLGLGCWV